MNRRHPLTLEPFPSFGLGWLCDHVRGSVQLPGEAAFDGSCQSIGADSRPHAVILAEDWTDVEAARAYAEANGLDITSMSSSRKVAGRNSIIVRTPQRTMH